MILVNDGGRIAMVARVVDHSNDDCACPDNASYFVGPADAGQAGNDCACASVYPAGSAGATTTQAFRCAPDTLVVPLERGYSAALSPFAPAGPSVLNDAALAAWRSFQVGGQLTSPLDHFLAAEGLVIGDLDGPVLRESSPTTLTAWLHVTNACNLDCPYCYVRKSSATMREETGIAALERLFREAAQQGFRQVKLKYAGGESTLQMGLVRRLHAAAVRLAAQWSLDLQAVILSNGTHLRTSDAAWLRTEGVKLMVSVDGVGDSHDRQRPMRNGGPTFVLVERTIDTILLPQGIVPDISITITQQNARTVDEVVEWALGRGLPVSLNFYRETEQARDPHALVLEEDAIIAGLQAAYAAFAKRMPEQPFLNSLLDRVQFGAHTHTCSVGMAYVVITHEGKIAQCHMHLDRAVSTGSEFSLLDLTRQGLVQNISVEHKQGCSQCTYRYRCSGGCPIETYRMTGRWDVSSPHCRIYKTMMPEVVRLEGLRLLKTSAGVSDLH